jgi:hypothetical protein
VRHKIIFAIIVAILLISGMLWMLTFLQIDKCLDDGGHWNDAEKKCEFFQPSTSKLKTMHVGYLLNRWHLTDLFLWHFH